MKKVIILNENSFKKIKRLMIKEAVTNNAPLFGKTADYTGILKDIAKIQNLRVDRYKDYALENSWKEWEKTGYDKNCKEYFIYLSNFKRFMFGGDDKEDNGFLGNVSYIIDRVGGSLHHFLLSREWVDNLIGKQDYKFSNNNSNVGSEQKQCFYTTVLKLYQNPAIWNDFFFNPLFKDYAQKFFSIRDKLSDMFKTDKKHPGLYASYLALLPKDEYVALNKYVGIIDKIFDETGKNVIGWEIKNRLNQREDLFYNPQNDNEEEEF